MPKFTMLATISGTRNGQDWPAAGGVVDLPEGEGAKLVRAGLAVEGEQSVAPGSLNRAATVETARAPEPETTHRKKPSRRSVKSATTPAPSPDDEV